jgi:diguanylate cyclase (GGDEF)-like protein
VWKSHQDLVTFLSVAISGILLVGLVALYRRVLLLRDVIRLYNTAHNAELTFDNIIRLMTEELRRKVHIVAFYRKNRQTKRLEDNSGNRITATDHNAAVKSLFQLKPHRLSSRYPQDREIINMYSHESGLAFIPVFSRSETPCWETHVCEDKLCYCHGKRDIRCWLQSGKRLRGSELNTFAQKINRCVTCQSFQPVGVFLVRGNMLAKKTRYINERFTPLLHSALTYERANYSASTDHLTGILNKRSLMQNLDTLLKFSARYGQHLSLSMFDIDHFKRFNDTYGHQTGDLVLKDLAQLVRTSVRQSDVVCRYGGEEFTIIFPNTTKDVALGIAEKLRTKVESHILRCERGDLRITISMGVASFPEDESESMDALISKADAALYHAKKTSRNKVSGYRASQFKKATHRKMN